MLPSTRSAGDLAEAARDRTDLVFVLYQSLYEWFHPLVLEVKQNDFKTQLFSQVSFRPSSDEQSTSALV